MRATARPAIRILPGAMLALALWAPTQAPGAAGPVSASIEQQIPLMFANAGDNPGSTSDTLLRALYDHRGYTAAWTNPASVQQLVDAIESSIQDGLNPSDYHQETILQLRAQQLSGNINTRRSADLDLLLTDSLLRLVRHLSSGRLDPRELDPEWSIPVATGMQIDRQLLEDTIANGRVSTLLQSARPKSPVYRGLRQTLARYRDYRARGGWQAIAPGTSMKPGVTDGRIVALRARLAASDELTSTAADPALYDAALVEDVTRFQQQHGLQADGVVGERTLAALNVPVQERIEQIRANLERARWVLHQLPDDFILVDIPGFTVRLVEHGNTAWQSRVVVGKPERRSPELHSTLTYLDLNPSWTVPPTVLAKDVLPELRRSAEYLQEKNMQVVDYQGRTVDTGAIDWSRYTSSNFPWLIRQQPGPTNALGQVKFMFANDHSVYLHDTPSRSLFRKTDRALSSGCIRIEHPLELADRLLRHNDGWDRTRLQSALRSMHTRSISLAKPIDIFLLYWTVDVEDDGSIRFSEDIYQRDPTIIQALNRPLGELPQEKFNGQRELSARR